MTRQGSRRRSPAIAELVARRRDGALVAVLLGAAVIVGLPASGTATAATTPTAVTPTAVTPAARVSSSPPSRAAGFPSPRGPGGRATVAITSPSPGSTVSGTVTIAVTVASAFSNPSVVFEVDGTVVGVDAAPPYQQEWNTARSPEGVARISVHVAAPRAGFGGLGTPAPAATETVTVANMPPSASAATSAAPTSRAPTPAKATRAEPAKEPLIVTLDFDDGTADQFQTLGMLKSRGLVGTYFVNSGRLGLSSLYMTLPQVLGLQAAGDEIGGHTVFHLHLPEQSPAEQQRQICIDRDQLLAAGLHITDMALPFGEFNQASLAAAKACGYDSVRTSEGVSACNGCPDGDTLPPANPYQLKALSSLGDKTLASSVINHVQHAAKAGGLVQLVFHRLCTQTPCRANALQLSQFTELLNWLSAQQARGMLKVETVHQAIGGPLHPPVSAPANTATTLAVPNASFEQGQTDPGVPVCWEHILDGDGNQPTWSLVHDAHTGQWAQQLVLPAVGGGVGMSVTQDEGSCAAPIQAGDRYTIGVWYESTAPIHLTAYRRLPAGGYVGFGLSAAFPASPGHWSYATFTTPTTPAGANAAISPGVAIKNPGTFTFDDVTLADAGPAPKPASAGVTSNAPPQAAGLQVPMVANRAQVTGASSSGWSANLPLLYVIAAVVAVLAVIDRRLAWLRRSTRRHPDDVGRRLRHVSSRHAGAG